MRTVSTQFYAFAHGRGKWALMLGASLFVTLFGFGLYRVHETHKVKTRLTEFEVEKQALAICAGFSENASVLDKPTFRDEYLHVPTGGYRHRYLWFVPCKADGKHYQVMINDQTGKLTCLIADDRAQVARLDRKASAAYIRTPDQAISASVERMQELSIVSSGARIRLVRPPERQEDGRTWEIIWQVRRSQQSQPGLVKLLLDGQVGTPLLAVDHYELEQFGRNGNGT